MANQPYLFISNKNSKCRVICYVKKTFSLKIIYHDETFYNLLIREFQSVMISYTLQYNSIIYESKYFIGKEGRISRNKSDGLIHEDDNNVDI